MSQKDHKISVRGLFRHFFDTPGREAREHLFETFRGFQGSGAWRLLCVGLTIVSQGLVFCLPFRQKFARNWGKGALFSPKKHDQFWSCFSSPFSLLLPRNGQNMMISAFQKGRKVGRKRGLRQKSVPDTPGTLSTPIFCGKERKTSSPCAAEARQ